MKRAFTLIELLIVVAIMGLLGTVSVGGYRQMQRGMEERGVLQNVNTFVRNAYNRAQIDRQPVAIYFWNELIREEDQNDFESAIVVGRAVAVRRSGRVTQVYNNTIIDEFGDFEQYDEDGEYEDDSKDSKDPPIRLYNMSSKGDMEYSLVKSIPQAVEITESFVTHDPHNDNNDNTKNKGKMTRFGYKISNQHGADWKVGSAYGFEFQSIELPHGYIFGSNYPKTMASPVSGEDERWFEVNGSAPSRIEIYSLRPGDSGSIEAKSIGKSEDPTQRGS